MHMLSLHDEREAYESQIDAYARVTFDRKTRIRPTLGWGLFDDGRGEYRFDDHWRLSLPTAPVVLELKCETSAIPEWLTGLIHRNQLEQASFSKHSIGTCLNQRSQGSHVGASRSLRGLFA